MFNTNGPSVLIHLLFGPSNYDHTIAMSQVAHHIPLHIGASNATCHTTVITESWQQLATAFQPERPEAHMRG